MSGAFHAVDCNEVRSVHVATIEYPGGPIDVYAAAKISNRGYMTYLIVRLRAICFEQTVSPLVDPLVAADTFIKHATTLMSADEREVANELWEGVRRSLSRAIKRAALQAQLVAVDGEKRDYATRSDQRWSTLMIQLAEMPAFVERKVIDPLARAAKHDNAVFARRAKQTIARRFKGQQRRCA